MFGFLIASALAICVLASSLKFYDLINGSSGANTTYPIALLGPVDFRDLLLTPIMLKWVLALLLLAGLLWVLLKLPKVISLMFAAIIALCLLVVLGLIPENLLGSKLLVISKTTVTLYSLIYLVMHAASVLLMMYGVLNLFSVPLNFLLNKFHIFNPGNLLKIEQLKRNLKTEQDKRFVLLGQVEALTNILNEKQNAQPQASPLKSSRSVKTTLTKKPHTIPAVRKETRNQHN